MMEEGIVVYWVQYGRAKGIQCGGQLIMWELTIIHAHSSQLLCNYNLIYYTHLQDFSDGGKDKVTGQLTETQHEWLNLQTAEITFRDIYSYSFNTWQTVGIASKLYALCYHCCH